MRKKIKTYVAGDIVSIRLNEVDEEIIDFVNRQVYASVEIKKILRNHLKSVNISSYDSETLTKPDKAEDTVRDILNDKLKNLTELN